jgi:ProP effector
MKRRHPLHPHTAIINKTQKIQSKQARHQALQWLTQRFPEAFDNTRRIRPLKNGIIHDIFQKTDEALLAGISRSKLREAVVVFTRRLDYLTCLKAQEMRIDLQGNPIEPVSLEEAELAAAKIKKRIEKSLQTRPNNSVNKTDSEKKARINSPSDTYKHASTSGYSSKRQDTSRSASATITISNTQEITAHSAEVIVKHKVTRTYDPSAVARLKEKLGLAQKELNTYETLV